MPRRSWREAAVLLAAVLAAAGTARLGVWQLDRAASKIELHQAQLARAALPALTADRLAPAGAALTPDLLHRRVVLEGRWLEHHGVYLDNRQYNGRPGFFVVMPLQLGPGDAVLVQRGWLARDARERSHIAAFDTPTGPVRIEGRIAPGAARLFEFDARASGAIRQNLDIAAFARETGLALRPFLVVQLDAGGTDGLRREGAPAAPDVSRHHGYALQWFSLSALITGLYVWFRIIRPRPSR